MKELLSVEEAVQIIQKHTDTITETEVIPIHEAGGRILAEEVCSPIDQPPFNRSPVDGYACLSEDLADCDQDHPAVLKVIGELDAGDPRKFTVNSGEAVRIMTGAPVPDGCDCCIRQEDTDYGEIDVNVYKAHKPWQNVCFQGEDYRCGAVLIEAGTKLTFIEIGILASIGADTVLVYRKPVVTVFTTGDEVIEPGQPLTPAKIFNSNGYLLEARLRELGAGIKARKIIPDDPARLAEELLQAAGVSDLIITTGGVSVGKKDILHESLELAGAICHFWRIKMKPGTPTIFSVLADVPVVSLSGNPFGAAANFELLIRPLLAKISMDHTMMYIRTQAVMAEDFLKSSPGRRFVRAIINNGNITLPQGLHSSGVIGSMRGCNCMIDIPAENMGLRAGDQVAVILL